MSIIVKVIQDSDPFSPREWSNLGVMACWHSRYNLGDVQPKQDPEEWLKENAPEGSIVLPLYLMDHSGISIRVSSFNDRWDSGQVGYIVATPEAIRKAFQRKRITRKTLERAEAVLKQEVSTYDDFLTGNVWGYTIQSDDGSADDSCWGFFGDDLDGMKGHVNAKHHEALEEAWEHRGQ